MCSHFFFFFFFFNDTATTEIYTLSLHDALPISAVGQIADVVLLAASAGVGLQNSLVAPLAVANALLNGVAAAKGTSALERYGRHDHLMKRWDAFLLKLGER